MTRNELLEQEEPMLISLTKQERLVLHHFLRGLRWTEIARTLAIAPRLVFLLKGHLLRKLQVRNELELTAFAVRHGLVSEMYPHQTA